eukprot:CAMPEP_0176006240 /NCGR_PEP_ID=MMETSP0120_2-20121206/2619_1 /TAXON_ID=160619 /ORGANISM="Kryptoperidinium foliaceum, Strain CCMP 1326" /LENGTH=721 /DNA_ID=CAMNT_0017338971 /DNA_START=62 /DNA_END=2224 /DNA_ORIENTATION=-
MLFESVVAKDHDALIRLYASNARNSLVSYLSVKSRWARQQEFYSKSEEKRDESLQQAIDGSDRSRLSPYSLARREDDTSFHFLLEELSKIIAATSGKESSGDAGSLCPVKISKEADRLLWETSSILSDSRPPADLCVFNKEGDTTPPDRNDQIPPIFDGSWLNATPPPLGGASAGASGGAGTILHLACAMDQPLVLAFLLIMGADGRASHTAFRRLMVHEAACNGSIDCLSLLLELGKKYSETFDNQRLDTASAVPFFPEALSLPSASSLTSNDQTPAIPPVALHVRHLRRESERLGASRGDFLAIIRQFRMLSKKVEQSEMKQLDAARALMKSATLMESTQVSLIRSCTFNNDYMAPRTFLRPHGNSDGHGNTPPTLATFKNETACVGLLLEYDANPNARAHPSGWTPLHDAAYSNSSASIELLIEKGARVDARANSGATPLCFAAQEDSADAALLLLQKGADLTARCAGAPDDGNGNGPIHPHSRFSGYTPLHYCAHYNAHKAAQVLLGHPMAKAAMETADLSGRLPIHVAVARGSSDVLRELLHAGARVDTRPINDGGTPRPAGSPNAFFALPDTGTPRRQPPSPEVVPASPNRNRVRSRSSSTASPVTSPVLRSLIPEQPISSAKPWNCLTQQAIDECKELISKAEQSWSPDRHLLFTPRDRKAVMELLRVGKRLEQQGVLFVDLWPQVLGFCGRGWFEPAAGKNFKPRAIEFPEKE